MTDPARAGLAQPQQGIHILSKIPSAITPEFRKLSSVRFTSVSSRLRFFTFFGFEVVLLCYGRRFHFQNTSSGCKYLFRSMCRSCYSEYGTDCEKRKENTENHSRSFSYNTNKTNWLQRKQGGWILTVFERVVCEQRCVSCNSGRNSAILRQPWTTSRSLFTFSIFLIERLRHHSRSESCHDSVSRCGRWTSILRCCRTNVCCNFVFKSCAFSYLCPTL